MKHNKHYYETDRNIDPYKKDERVPEYYKGRNNYQARKVCDNFDLTYHLATATTYILRAYRKHDEPTECIKKAIAHLEFELENYAEKQLEKRR